MGTYGRDNPMISMQNVIITGGTFTDQRRVDGRKSPFDILKDAVAHTAFHDSAARFDPPKCHPNTRVAVLDKIMNWIRRCDSETREKYIMWLTGAAGAGKSAIAQSLIELCLLHDLVIASFFFGRSDTTRNHGGALVATLAYQIYHCVPAIQQDMLSVIEADPLILTRRLEHQFTHLIGNTLKNLCSSGAPWPSGSHRVIVIDGLDECIDARVQQQILRIISNAVRAFELPLVFLVASRPEHDINVAFASREMTGILARLYLDDTVNSDEDIRTFLNDSFEEIKTSHPFKRLIPALWPSRRAVDELVRKSSGQFIFAVTVIRFVESIRHQPHLRLDVVLSLRPPEGELPFAQLDALYALILSSAADIKRVLYAISIYTFDVLEGHVCVSELMSLENGELEVLFCDLGSLVSVVGTDSSESPYPEYATLKILHASLHDFLLDRQRSKEYFLDIDVYRSEHLANILHYVTKGSAYGLNIHDQIKSISFFSEANFPLCQGSDHLVQRAFLFPLERLLSGAMRDNYCPMSNFIFFTFLPFLSRMGRLDDLWTEIEQDKYADLDRVLLSKMPSYYSNHDLSALLCLVYHAGENSFIPCFHSSLFCDTLVTNPDADTLMLQRIYLGNIGTENDQYRQCVVRFLGDGDRSGRYAIGINTYTKAALSFIEKLAKRPCTEWRMPSDHNEQCLHDRLVLENGIWRISQHANDGTSNCTHSNNIKYESAVASCFVCLGYLLFFLPRAGESPLLIQQCHQQTFLTTQMIDSLPNRTALVREAMREYLERVGPTRNIG